MLAHRETLISNQVQLEPGIIYAPQFLQTTLACQPDAVRSNLHPAASTLLIGKRALSIGNETLVLTQVTLVKEEVFHTIINRFQPSKSHMMLLNLGPSPRHYYTRRSKAIVLDAGDLLLVDPHVDVFYGRCMLRAVLDEEKEDGTLVVLFEGHFEK